MTSEVKRVPELRFPEFSGEWEEEKLRDLLEDNVILEQSDGNHGELYPKSSEFTEDGIPYLAASNISNNSISYQNIKYLPLERAKQFKKGVARDGDILLAHNATVGPSTLLITDFPFVILSTTLTLYRINKVKMDNHFFLNEIRSNNVQNQLKKLMKQTTRNQVPILLQRTMHISYPKILAEQHKIGSFFSKLDQQIELEEQKLSLLEEQKKGYMKKIFSQELRFKDENGNDYPEWEIKKLMQIAKVKTGSKNVQDNIQDGKYKFFDRSVEVKYLNTFDFDETAIIYPGEGSKFLPRYFSGKYSLHQRAYSIYDININNNYLYYYLSLQNNHFLKYAVGSTVKSLRMSGFDKLKVMVPKNSEQEKIGSFFKNLDEFIEKQANKVELLKQRKQSFLQKMFV